MKRSFACRLFVLLVWALASLPSAARAEKPAVTLSLGILHSCSVTSGVARCWGYNGHGQLGDGSNESRSAPIDVTALGAGVASISAGGNHTCAVKTDGTLWCWGDNGYGQVGDGTLDTRPVPTPVPTLGGNVAQVSAGRQHTCALKTDGTIWCWGSGAEGRLGDGTSVNRSLPTLVLGFSDAVEVAAGVAHTCARKNNGTVWCWGDNRFGALGDGTTASRSSPIAASGFTAAVELAASEHTCARRSDGSLWCWGYNRYGQLGDGTNANRTEPRQVSTMFADVTEVSAGAHHTCARKIDNKLRCWGLNASGQLGDGTTTQRRSPTLVWLGNNATDIAAGEDHTCARKDDGTTWCTGSNVAGQLGNGSLSSRTSYGPTIPSAAASVPIGGMGNAALLAALLLVGGMMRLVRLGRARLHVARHSG
jgi:alpha-tubulin suppressor-like RCC1 family protein